MSMESFESTVLQDDTNEVLSFGDNPGFSDRARGVAPRFWSRYGVFFPKSRGLSGLVFVFTKEFEL